MLVNNKVLADKFIVELIEIFNKHNWRIEKSNGGEYSLFDMFCKRLEVCMKNWIINFFKIKHKRYDIL